jgi:hypothetical protein
MTPWQSIFYLLFSWPGVYASLCLATAGLLFKSPKMLVAGALLVVPFGLYTSTFVGLYGLPLVTLALYLAAPLLLRRGRLMAAALLVFPFFATAATIRAMVALQ